MSAEGGRRQCPKASERKLLMLGVQCSEVVLCDGRERVLSIVLTISPAPLFSTLCCTGCMKYVSNTVVTKHFLDPLAA